MKSYILGHESVDSVELKCLVISRGVLVDPRVYEEYAGRARLSHDPMTCNCTILPDGTIVQLTDLALYLRPAIAGLTWEQALSTDAAKAVGTPFSITMRDGRAALCYQGEPVCALSFPPATDFYERKTSDGHPYVGNTVLQGRDWVAFQCLWPCEHAASGKPCQYCYCGFEYEAMAKAGQALPSAFPAEAAGEIVADAIRRDLCCGVQVTGGSTFSETREAGYINSYLEAIAQKAPVDKLHAGILLYTTPPKDRALLDGYFERGIRKVACSLEVWDEARANVITPGKTQCSTRRQHLDALEYVAETYGPGKAFSNFIIGLESFETLMEGASYLAKRGILPSASVWMPMGKPVLGSVVPPELDFYRRVKEGFAALYTSCGLEPGECSGLNVCIEQDIWNYAVGK